MMRTPAAILILLLACLHTADAQPMPPPEGGVFEAYYEDENPGRVMGALLRWNVCIERFTNLNPGVDLEHISYGTRVRLPLKEQCYDPQSKTYPTPRLKYYEDGRWLDQPYYAQDVVYIRADTVKEISKRYNVCEDDLLAQNVILRDFSLEMMQFPNYTLDIFVPSEAPPCDRDWADPAPLARYWSGVKPVPVKPADFTPMYFLEKYNLCYEAFDDINFRDWGIFGQYSGNYYTRQVRLPQHEMPCYNEQGQRLLYHDIETGLPLDTPVYSDYFVYRMASWDTLPAVANSFGLCLLDLLRLNGFRDVQIRHSQVEIFIPPARPCTENFISISSAWSDTLTNYLEAAIDLNICPEVLLALNPHLDHARNGQNVWAVLQLGGSVWAVMPDALEPCYRMLRPLDAESIYDIEYQYNVCYEELILASVGSQYPYVAPSRQREAYYARLDAPPCYNENGQRLLYPATYNPAISAEGRATEYSTGDVERFLSGDSVYEISRRTNVCVRDILAANPRLVSARPVGIAVYVPDTRPCYDEATGLPLIYEDAEGQPLAVPRVGENLVYYGAQPMGYVSYYYNVCQNRINDVNQAKHQRETAYLGWIIPTDRPPCYDESGAQIDYACYDIPLDMRADYRNAEYRVTPIYEGTHCYELWHPDTVVWVENRPYIAVRWENNLLQSRAFTAWCFGVPQAEIDAVYGNQEVIALLPRFTRLVPQPTRACYLQDPTVLDGHMVHTVQAGETLRGIAAHYGIFWPLVALQNQLDADGTIWIGQKLIIPDIPVRRVGILLGGGAGVGVLVAALWFVRRHRERMIL